MIVTVEKLNELKACDIGIRWFEKHYPNGATLEELVNNKKTPKEFLHWGYTHLRQDSQEFERDKYWERLEIKCQDPTSISLSEKIINSQDITRCKNVSNSKCIVTSNNIFLSEMVQASRDVENSEYIFNSQEVLNSKRVYKSNKVFNSDMIGKSEDVSDSKVVLHGENIKSSFCIIGSEDSLSESISNGYFMLNVAKVNHGMFCYDLKQGEYLIFNKPVSQSEFEVYEKQLQTLISNWVPDLLYKWGEKKKIPDVPEIKDAKSVFQDCPEGLLDWVKTLPNYDENILNKIFFKQ